MKLIDGDKLKEKVMQQYGTNEKGWENSEFKKLFDSCTLPGNLLVSFKGHVYKSDLKKCQDGGETDIILFYTPPITDPENRQSVTVLILDEGSEEKNEKDI